MQGSRIEGGVEAALGHVGGVAADKPVRSRIPEPVSPLRRKASGDLRTEGWRKTVIVARTRLRPVGGLASVALTGRIIGELRIHEAEAGADGQRIERIELSFNLQSLDASIPGVSHDEAGAGKRIKGRILEVGEVHAIDTGIEHKIARHPDRLETNLHRVGVFSLKLDGSAHRRRPRVETARLVAGSTHDIEENILGHVVLHPEGVVRLGLAA